MIICFQVCTKCGINVIKLLLLNKLLSVIEIYHNKIIYLLKRFESEKIHVTNDH